MSGWGGVVLAGLAGAASGVGSAITQDALEQEKIKAQRDRDEYLAALQVNTHKQIASFDTSNIGAVAKAKSDAAAATAEQDAATLAKKTKAEEEAKIAATGKVVPEGSTWVGQDGKPIFTAPKTAKVLSDDELEIMRFNAETRRQNVEAHAADMADRRAAREALAAGKVTKADMANFKDIKGEGGIPTGMQVDDSTGIYRKWVDAQPGQPAKSGVFGIGAKEAVPEKKGGFVYFDENMNQMAPEAVNKKYPKLNRDAEASATAPAAASPEPTIKAPSGRPSGAGMASGKIGSAGKVPVERGKDPTTGKWLIKYSDGSIAPE